MKVFHAVSEARELAGCALALGNFDGVHLGHQALFAEARRHAALAANMRPDRQDYREFSERLRAA